MGRRIIQVYKKGFSHTLIKPTKKVVVFDLDETIGCFTDLEVLWSGIKEFFSNNKEDFVCDQKIFNELMDLYPEFLRYGILNILDFLYYKKQRGELLNIYIYTNNKLPKLWSEMIVKYIENKQGTEGLFDKIINAFKINKHIIEPSRTTHTKTYSDFIKCSLLPKTTEICFIDDCYFKKMNHNKIYYIQPRMYYHGVSTSEIIRRFEKSNIIPDNQNRFSSFIQDYFISNNALNVTPKSKRDIEVDLIVSRKIMYHIQEFFRLTTKQNSTRKIRLFNIGRFTRKRLT